MIYRQHRKSLIYRESLAFGNLSNFWQIWWMRIYKYGIAVDDGQHANRFAPWNLHSSIWWVGGNWRVTASVRLSCNYISFKIIDFFVILSCGCVVCTNGYSQDTRLTFIIIAIRIKNSGIEFVKFVCPREFFSLSFHRGYGAWMWMRTKISMSPCIKICFLFDAHEAKRLDSIQWDKDMRFAFTRSIFLPVSPLWLSKQKNVKHQTNLARNANRWR